jgi:glycosyltransferase involved in cell wall biosynthesis
MSKDSLRIAIVSDAYFPQISGVATTIKATADELERRGHEVLIISPRDFKVKVPLPTYSEIKLVVRPYPKVRKMLDAFNPHAIHISVEGPLGMAAKKYAKRRKLHYTTAYHTRFPEYVNVRTGIPVSWGYAVARNFHNGAAQVMVAAESLRSELDSWGFKNLAIWPRGVDTNLFSPERARVLPHEGPIFMYMGRVAPEKNIEAFLSLELPGVKYVIGDGPDRKRLEAKYPEAVFVGYKFGEELASYLGAASVFVFPSLTDTLGLVMLEANACGVPVATYPSQASSAVIQEGENGVVDEDLKEACLKALAVSRARCREIALERGWEKPADLFLANLVPALRAEA